MRGLISSSLSFLRIFFLSFLLLSSTFSFSVVFVPSAIADDGGGGDGGGGDGGGDGDGGGGYGGGDAGDGSGGNSGNMGCSNSSNSPQGDGACGCDDSGFGGFGGFNDNWGGGDGHDSSWSWGGESSGSSGSHSVWRPTFGMTIFNLPVCHGYTFQAVGIGRQSDSTFAPGWGACRR